MSLKQDHSSTYTGLHKAHSHPLGPQPLKSHFKIICSLMFAYGHHLRSYLEFSYQDFAPFFKKSNNNKNKTKQKSLTTLTHPGNISFQRPTFLLHFINRESTLNWNRSLPGQISCFIYILFFPFLHQVCQIKHSYCKKKKVGIGLIFI